MRILWVKAGQLLPLNTGGRLRSYHVMKRLARRHELTLLSYYDGAEDPAYGAALSEALPGAIAMASGLRLESPVARAAHYLRCLPSPAPYAVRKFTTPRVRSRLRDALAEGHIDVAVCDFLSASLNFPRRLTTPTALFQHNVESLLWERQARMERHPIRRAAFTIEAAKMRAYEARAVRRFDQVIAVSDEDRRQFLAMAPSAPVRVVPTGVDVAAFRPPPGQPPCADPIVLFLGSMDWMPNVDAVEWFCDAIWPRVRAQVTQAVFRVVGRNPDPRILRRASDSIEITGTVPAVQDYLHQSAVVVVPLRIGGGTRLKIFEAMAAAKAVVSTRLGAEGLDVEDGVEVLLRDDADGFADAVVRLLLDQAARARLEAGALRVAERYDWDEVVSRFEEALETCRDSGAPGRRSGAAAA